MVRTMFLMAFAFVYVIAPSSPLRGDEKDESALSEVKKAFTGHNINPKLFSKEIDPSVSDSLVVLKAWELVQEDVRKSLKGALRLKREPSIAIAAVKTADKKYKVAFLIGGQEKEYKQVSSLLAQVTGHEGRFFLNAAIVSKVIPVNVPAIKDAYAKNGKVDPGSISDAIVDMLQNAKTPLKSLNLSPKVTVLDKKKGSFQILTAPVRVKENLLDNHACFWRIHIRFDREEDEDDKWMLTTRIDVGHIPLSNISNLGKINFRAPNSNTEDNPTYRNIDVATAPSVTAKNEGGLEYALLGKITLG